MHIRLAALLLATAAIAALPTRVLAATILLGSSADAGLFEFQPDNNLGGMFDVPSGTLGSMGNGGRTRALFKFDLAGQIPADAIIDSVTLTLRVTVEPPTPVGSEFGLHRVLQDWGEGVGTGNQGQFANAGEVTWNSRFAGQTAWAAGGGLGGTDYTTAPSGATFISASQATYQWGSSPEMVADIQYWLQNPGDNFGWMLISNDESSSFTAKRFATRELSTASQRPRLDIQYTVVPEPATVTLGVLALVGFAGWRRWHRR